MSTQTFTAPRQLEAWVSFLRSHAAITRELSAQLQREHGLTLNDYEVLLHLSHADDGRLRRVDLAERVLLTASGITRLLEGLESSGFVSKETCASDARVSYAKLTEAGEVKLKRASITHLRGIDELFVGRYSGSELATLAELLARLPVTGSDCKSVSEPCS
jgi:DNA-binding MarR family transcriptional regulator